MSDNVNWSKNVEALNKDWVSLTLGQEQVLIATGFEINQSVLEQPNRFELRLGRGSIDPDPKKGPTVKDLIRSYPPNTPFELRINGNLRMTGVTDGYRCTAAGNSATEMTIFGRDCLAPLHDAHIASDVSFTDATYASLVQAVLKLIGLDPSNLTKSGNADRQLKSGVPIKELLPVRTIEEILKNAGEEGSGGAGVSGFTAGAVHQTLHAKIGERWLDFVRHQLDRAGLFLWAGADGKFILSAPNVNVVPAYRIFRKQGQNREESNVVHVDFLNDTRPRYSFVNVYGKGGGRIKGPKKSIGNADDTEMTDFYGFDHARALVIRDRHCQNNAQASYLAQRKLAEGRRHGFQLVYTMSGLSTVAVDGGRAVWTPDTTVDVTDEEFGINDTFWIDSVEFRRNPQTTTQIRLIRLQDLVFGTPDFEGAGATVQTGFVTPKDIEETLG